MSASYATTECPAGTRRVIHVCGRADFVHCRPLRDFLHRYAHPGRGEELIVEFSGCRTMDSTVLGLLAEAALRLKDTPEPLVLANLSASPRRAVTQLGINHLVRLAEMPELAAAANPVDAEPVPMAREAIRRAHEALVEVSPGNRDLFGDFLALTQSQPA